MDLSKIKYSTDKMGTIYIEWNGVDYVKTTKIFQVRSSGGMTYFCSIGRSEDQGSLALIMPNDTFNLAKERIVEITRIRSGFWHRLDGTIDVGLNQTKANDLLQWNLGFKTSYRTKKIFSEIVANSLITEQSEKETTTKQDANFSFNRYVGKRAFVGIKLAAEQNSELGLDLRVSSTFYGGSDVLHTNSSLLLPSAGVMVNREISNGSESATDNVEGLIQVRYQAFSYDEPELSIDAFIAFFPSFTIADRYRINSDLKVRYELFSDLFLGVSFYYQYDSEPPNADAVSTDYGTKLSLGYSW